MRKSTLLLILSLFAFLIGEAAATQPLTISRSEAADAAETVSKAYGIRVYGENATGIDLVSFDVDNPSVFKVEDELPFTHVRAAAAHDGTYYIVTSSESDAGITANSFVTYDIATHKATTVKEYGIYDGKNLIFYDMTYDSASGKLYAIAMDVSKAEGSGEDLSAPLGLYTIDPKTGETTWLGDQEYVMFLGIAMSPDGELYGIDTNGTLWIMSKTSGTPSYEIGFSYDLPSSIQSMSFDEKNNILYWAGFSISGSTGSGFLSQFTFNDEGGWYSKIGSLEGNAEIVGLYIDPNPSPKTAPEAVSNFTATPAESGLSEVTLSWTNPSTDLNGNELADFSIRIYRNDQAIATLPDQVAGETASYKDTEVNGTVIYKVVGVKDDAEGTAVYSESVFAGIDAPNQVQNLSVTKAADSYDVTISWDKPTEGAHGGYFNDTDLRYKVVRYPDEMTVGSDLTATTCTDNTITETAGYYYQVVASSKDANGNYVEGTAAESNTVVSGPALTTPYSCDFSTDAQYRLWAVFDSDADGQTWTLSSNYQGTTDSFMMYFPDQELNPDKEASDWFISAPIHLEKGKQYAISYSLRSQNTTLFPVTYRITLGNAQNPDAQSTEIASYTKDVNGNSEQSQDFEDYQIPFVVGETGDYCFGFEAGNAVMMQFTNIKVEEIALTDLSATSLTGTIAPSTKESNKYTVKVQNLGYNEVAQYEVQLVDESGNVLASQQQQQAIASQEEQSVTIEWTPNKSGSYSIAAKVVADGDENADNDNSPALAVTVWDGGSWKHITDGTSESGFTPYYLDYPQSMTQTIYTKEQIAASAGSITGMIFHYTHNAYNTKPTADFNAKVYLANTDLTEFDSETPEAIALDNFTLVYDGTVSAPRDLNEAVFTFATPFNYTGGNLCVYTTQESDGDDNPSIRWTCYYKSNDSTTPTILYRGDDAFDFSQSVRAVQDRANASFYVATKNGGISSAAAQQDGHVYVNSATNTLVVDGSYRLLQIFNLTGSMVASSADSQPTVSLKGLSKGVYLVAVQTSDNGNYTQKIVVK